MNIIINDKNILEYEIIKDKSNFQVPFVAEKPNIFFESEKYTFIQIKNIIEGLMIESVSCNETEVYLFDKTFDSANNIIAIKNIDQNINLSFTFTEGYRLKIFDEVKNKLQVFFYKPNTFVSIKINGKFNDNIVKEIYIDSKNPTNIDVKTLYSVQEGNVFYSKRECSFYMPKQNIDIYIKYYPLNKNDFSYIKIDLSNIEKYSYSDNRQNRYNPYFENFITLANYSDDYDAGLTDEVINQSKEYIFGKNCNIRIKLNLLQELNLKILFNGKTIDSTLSLTKHNVQAFSIDEDEEIVDDVFEYDFKFIKLNESGIISFEIEK